ncbi:hypothetical protein BDR26DRAFT_865933 [Obelidium mucronatum]|nr:hypothetical protein BDR26DRAFT_865933 [Obelidium mucronatum]
MSLKIKTMSYSNAEMGKKLEASNKAISDLISTVAKLEGEKAAALFLVERMKTEGKALELRARTAEAAVNAYDQEFKKSVEALLAVATNAENGLRTGVINNLVSTSAPKIISVKLTNNKSSKSNKLDVTDFSSSDDDFSDVEGGGGYMSDDPTKITRKVINDTAKMLAGKKKFDPPSILSVGLKSCLEKEEQLCNQNVSINPSSRPIPPHPTQMQATSYRPSNIVPRLSHQAIDHVNHLSNVLSAQTQHLLSASTPSEYLRILHSQLEGMTHSIHECLDALAEERRIREKWRAKWEKTSWLLKKEVARRKKEVEEREGTRYRGSYLVNALEPISGYHRSTADVLDDVLGTTGSQSATYANTSGDRKRAIQTAPQGTRKVGFEINQGASPPNPLQYNVGHNEDMDMSERWESRSRGVASGHPNRPRYQSNMGSAAGSTARALFKPRGQPIPQSPARIPTVKNETDGGENNFSQVSNSLMIADSRLMDIVGYSSSCASSTFASDLTGTKPIIKKVNYSIPPVSAVTPFENPLIKKRLRKKSPASAINRHWDTSGTIL